MMQRSAVDRSSGPSAVRSMGVTVRKSHVPSKSGLPHDVRGIVDFLAAGASFAAAGADDWPPAVCAATPATASVTASRTDVRRSRISIPPDYAYIIRRIG